MSSIFDDGALHPGRDANDAWWIPVRGAAAWDGAVFDGAVLDPVRAVVELEPAPLAASEDLDEIEAPDGTRYRSDRWADQLLRRRPCDADFAPIPGLGGTGWSTGRFRNPAGLAFDDCGRLYVADRGNHRVQVIAPDEGRVVIVLGAVDAWGRPAAGSGRGQMDEPIAVAVGRSRIYVAERDGTIHVYDRMFRFDRSFEARRPGATAPPVVLGIAVDGNDLLVVADSGWSRLSRFSCAGEYVGDLPLAEGPASLAGLAGLGRFAPEGTVVLGPIDGGLERLAWHRIAVDAELPPGTTIEVQTYAVDPPPTPPTMPPPAPPILPPSTPWAPASPVAIPVGALEPQEGESVRPVLSDIAGWERWQGAPFRRGAQVHGFTGDGPNTSATMILPYAAARRLRAGDGLALRNATAADTPVVLSISDRTITVVAGGTVPGDYVGATVTLIERDGRSVDAAVIHTLTAPETVDLTSFADGDVADVVVPHGLAALLRPGDVVELVAAPGTARIRIEAIDAAPAMVQLVAAVTGDFRTAVLRITDPAGRLVVEHATGWGTGFPPGDPVEVDWDDAGTVRAQLLNVVWSDPETATIWTQLAAPATWLQVRPGRPPLATDRGRYLWVRLRLRGARRRPTDGEATATPVVRGLRLIAPRRSYLTELPAVYSRRDDRDPSGAIFLERFLALFEGRLTGVEGSYEAVARLLNPFAADDAWLDFVATWFDLILDGTWPRARRARLLAEIFDLYRRRGTAEGIRRVVELYTDRRPELVEGFQIRPRGGMVLGCYGVLGCAPLGCLDPDGAASPELLAAYAHRFTLVAYVDDDCDLEVAVPALRAIVDAIKPAHTDVDLRIAAPNSRIGVETTVGLDFVLGDERARPAPLGTASATARPSPVLGLDARLGGIDSTIPLDDAGPTAVGSFSIG